MQVDSHSDVEERVDGQVIESQRGRMRTHLPDMLSTR